MTKPQEASAFPGSEAIPDIFKPAPDDLICPAQDIFDHHIVLAEVSDAIAAATSEKDVRGATVKVLRKARSDGMAAIATAFRAAPFRSRPTTQAYSWLTDQVVKSPSRQVACILAYV